jgi:hypothetical protein
MKSLVSAWIRLRNLFRRHTKDGVRDQRTLPFLESLLRDVRLGFRALTANRALSVIAIIALTLGIGASTIIFSVIYSVFVDPLPYKNSNRLVVFRVQNLANVGGWKDRDYFLPDEIRAFREQNHVFEETIAYNGVRLQLPWGSLASGSHHLARRRAPRRSPRIRYELPLLAIGICWRPKDSLIADGLESAADVVSGLVVYFGLKISVKPPDSDHPYGHGKAEPIAAMVVGMFLIAAAVAIIGESIHGIKTPHPLPKPYTLVVLAGVLLVKEILFRHVGHVAAKIGSTAVKGDAWHHRSDAI